MIVIAWLVGILLLRQLGFDNGVAGMLFSVVVAIVLAAGATAVAFVSLAWLLPTLWPAVEVLPPPERYLNRVASAPGVRWRGAEPAYPIFSMLRRQRGWVEVEFDLDAAGSCVGHRHLSQQPPATFDVAVMLDRRLV